jgi:hypothetical protein
VFFAIAALYARRFSVWCGFVLAPVLAAALAERIGRTPTPVGSPARNALYLACVASLLFALPWLHFRPHPSTWIGPDTPVEATAELCRIAPDDARVYQDPGFASYQIFQCPRLRVFTDTRIEFYPLEMWKEFLAVAHGRYDWQEILDRYRIGYLLVPADDERYDGLRAAVAASGRWREIHRDPIAILWTRGEPLS